MPTIEISEELKRRIEAYGDNGDNMETTLKKMCDFVSKYSLHDWFYDTSNSVTAKEALEEAKRRFKNS